MLLERLWEQQLWSKARIPEGQIAALSAVDANRRRYLRAGSRYSDGSSFNEVPFTVTA